MALLGNKPTFFPAFKMAAFLLAVVRWRFYDVGYILTAAIQSLVQSRIEQPLPKRQVGDQIRSAVPISYAFAI
jgi:hypothetical protein